VGKACGRKIFVETHSESTIHCVGKSLYKTESVQGHVKCTRHYLVEPELIHVLHQVAACTCTIAAATVGGRPARLLLWGTPHVFAHVQVLAPPISGPRMVDFGRPIGRVTAWLYNLPEVASTHENLRVPSVSARFATAPFFWNWYFPSWHVSGRPERPVFKIGNWYVAKLLFRVSNAPVSVEGL